MTTISTTKTRKRAPMKSAMNQNPSPEEGMRAVAERIHSGRNFLITGHRNPDGDALGSGIALQGLIRKLGKTARVFVRDGFGKPLYNIPGADEVTISDTLPADYPDAYDAC